MADVAVLLPIQAAVLISVMPHGRLQIVRASSADPEFVRRYNRETQANDTATWDVLRTGAPLINPQRPLLPGRSMVVPAGSPVLAGYPAALHVFRREQESAFSEADADLLRGQAVETRNQLGNARVFVLDRNLSPLVNADAWAGLDERLRTAIAEHARARLNELGDDVSTLTDRRTHLSDPATVRTVRYLFSTDGPAHPGQPGVTVCLQPDVEEWAALRPDTVPSHAELGRFLPALQFMRANAGQNVTLNNVAASVGLSPFHFHRRFVDLTGMAPKQYLFDCQIADAQRMLIEGKLELSVIARECGFAHQSHFTSRFRQATRLTPTKWRKAMLMRQSM